jgi:hypothetical protein
MTLPGETVLRQRVCRGSGVWKDDWIIATGNGSTGAGRRERA